MADARQFPLPHSDLVGTDSRRLGAVVGMCHLPEPGVLERLLRRNALSGVVDKDFLQEIEELRQEWGRRGDDVLDQRQS